MARIRTQTFVPLVKPVSVTLDLDVLCLNDQFASTFGSELLTFMRETKNDAVMERVDKRGRVLGFSILQVSHLSKQKPIEAELETA
jgi:hypothetical protein